MPNNWNISKCFAIDNCQYKLKYCNILFRKLHTTLYEDKYLIQMLQNKLAALNQKQTQQTLHDAKFLYEGELKISCLPLTLTLITVNGI